MDRRYPALGATRDPTYRVAIPKRTDAIRRPRDVHYTTYDEVIAANFPAPKFAVKELPGKGRGVVATEAIAAGELLFHEQAALFFVGEEDENPMLDSTYEMTRDVFTGDALCTYALASQLAQTPSRNAEFQEHVAYITRHLQTAVDTVEEVTEEKVLTIVNGIHTNSFSLDFLDGYAVFLVCSLFNHACQENVGWHTVGDVMYLTALDDIPKGTELVINYPFPGIGEKRRRYFDENYGFICDCVLCATPRDPWRCFTCTCGGVMFTEKDGMQCHACRRIASQEENDAFHAEEEHVHALEKKVRCKYFYHPKRRMHPGHIYLFKAVRKFATSKACPCPLQLFEEQLIPVAQFHAELSRGRLYASILEQYGVACLRYAAVMPDLVEFCKSKAEKAFKKAYDYRCSLGMGRTGYAAAVYLEHIALFVPGNLEHFVDYEEF